MDIYHCNRSGIYALLQIQKLLRNMNLGQYLRQFSNEQIDGQLLSECDEKVLEFELSVTNAVHRLKLMKVITGKQSVIDICHKTP